MSYNCCGGTKLIFNDVLKGDPTRTLTTRRRFIAEIVKRFGQLKKAIMKVIVEDDFFGFNQNKIFKTNAPSDRLGEFMSWLEKQNKKFILSGGTEGIELITRKGVVSGIHSQWTDKFVRSAYQKGVSRAMAELKRIKAPVDTEGNLFEVGNKGFLTAFNQPIHLDRVGLAYTQTWESIKGVTKQMEPKLLQVLAEGMARGDNPKQIARMILDRVDKTGLVNAKTVARTEIIRAHHAANIAEYERAGIENVKVKAEWSTAGFNVCPLCAPLEGRVFELSEIRTKIPLHPNCRCVALPIVED